MGAVTSDESRQLLETHTIFRVVTTLVKESFQCQSFHCCVPKNKMNSKVAVFSDVTSRSWQRGTGVSDELAAFVSGMMER